MILRTLLGCTLLILGFSPYGAAAAHDSGKLVLSEPAQIPGLTLSPGTYSIHVVDHLSERFIVRVDAPKRGLHYSFLALENPSIPKPEADGPIAWNKAPVPGKEFLRGWLFPEVPAVLEFVYPKAEAVDLAKSNQAKVPAIDPASEGRPPLIKGLSKSDMEVVTLWLLSSTHVGPGDSAAGIQAERYPEHMAGAAHKPAIAKLPQTASLLPVVALLGTFSLVMAIGLRRARPAYARKRPNRSA